MSPAKEITAVNGHPAQVRPWWPDQPLDLLRRPETQPVPEAWQGIPAEPDAGPAVNPAFRLAAGQKFLAAAILVLAATVTPVFFIVMFLTVNKMLGPYFQGWAWTAPVATEATFTLLFLWAVLMEWLRKPKPLLWVAPYPFAGMSVFLNVWAAYGSVPGMVGHLAVTLAFFIPVTFAKSGVRALLVTDAERARAAALADAKAHARDMLRSALGLRWRWKTPLLLRRQLRAGRLPALVMEAVATGSATAWEPAVEAWIASAVALPERTREVLRAARAEASAPRPEAPSEAPPETPSQSVPEALPAAPPEALPAPPREASPEPPRKPSRPPRSTPPKPRRLIPSKASDEDLAAIIVPLLAEGDVSPTKVVKTIKEKAGGKASIGHDRAKDVLALARDKAATTTTKE